MMSMQGASAACLTDFCALSMFMTGKGICCRWLKVGHYGASNAQHAGIPAGSPRQRAQLAQLPGAAGLSLCLCLATAPGLKGMCCLLRQQQLLYGTGTTLPRHSSTCWTAASIRLQSKGMQGAAAAVDALICWKKFTSSASSSSAGWVKHMLTEVLRQDRDHSGKGVLQRPPGYMHTCSRRRLSPKQQHAVRAAPCHPQAARTPPKAARS